MPKLKTKSGAKKRFRLTATGKVRRQHAGKSHLNLKKSPKRLRNLRGTDIASPSDAKIIKKFIPYA